MSRQYNHARARTDAQAKRMKDLEKRNVCAFCRENIETETTSPIEIETKNWVVKESDYPYERTKHHLLIISKTHAKSVTGLSKAAQDEFLPLIAKIEKFYKLPSYAVAMRAGDMHYNGGSVEHIHAHVITGDTEHPDPDPVRFKVSSRPA
jgi:ATP adenylyltransferase